MIEILGYIFLYLIIGVVLLPFPMLVDKLFSDMKKKNNKYLFLFVWPAIIIISLLYLWWAGWEELKNYK